MYIIFIKILRNSVNSRTGKVLMNKGYLNYGNKSKSSYIYIMQTHNTFTLWKYKWKIIEYENKCSHINCDKPTILIARLLAFIIQAGNLL